MRYVGQTLELRCLFITWSTATASESQDHDLCSSHLYHRPMRYVGQTLELRCLLLPIPSFHLSPAGRSSQDPFAQGRSDTEDSLSAPAVRQQFLQHRPHTGL